MSLKENIELPRTYIDVQKELDEKIKKIVKLRKELEEHVIGITRIEDRLKAQSVLTGNLSHQQRTLENNLEQLRREAMIQRGDHVVVFRGRKADVGITGVVADIHYTGRYLVKDAANWRDRFIRGSWFNGDNLAKIYDET